MAPHPLQQKLTSSADPQTLN